jgi:hypothetical protein
VLQHDAAVHDIERTVREPAQVRRPIDHEAAAIEIGVQRARARNHRRRRVDADGLVEVPGERTRHAADPAAEIEGAPARRRRGERIQLREEALDVRLAGRQKFREVPFRDPAVLGENRPVRVVLRELIPDPAHPVPLRHWPRSLTQL